MLIEGGDRGSPQIVSWVSLETELGINTSFRSTSLVSLLTVN